MNLDHIPEMEATRMRWREILSALPESLVHAARRLMGLEHRSYLVMNGRVLARFVSPQAELEFINWIGATHRANADWNFGRGREYAVATQIRNGLEYIQGNYGGDSKEHAFDLTYADPDAGAAGPS